MPPRVFDEAKACAEAIIERIGHRIVMALPLGLGKANLIANAIFERAAKDSRIELEVLTALTLEKPRNRSDLEQRLVDPIIDRLFGDYPELAYAAALRDQKLPHNIKVSEFYLKAGGWLNVGQTQRAYISLNYMHAAAEILRRKVNVIAQLVAKRERDGLIGYSLSCNPDVTLDLLPELESRRAGGEPIAIVGEVNAHLPFMTGDAALPADRFDFILDGPQCGYRLFAPPRQAVTLADYAAGLHVASLVNDGGTLQIGIGSIGDAIVYGLILRHQQPETFQAVLGALAPNLRDRQFEPFSEGLYGCSEMLVDGFIDLYRAGILKRRVSSKNDGPVMHAAFFLGSSALYSALREMADTGSSDIAMTAVSFTNSLLGDEQLKREHRRHARFINNAMVATLLGDVTSDALADGRVVSGVGGQHDFVTQAHALADARAIIVLNAVRDDGKAASNIHWRYGHTTIPRHLRDVIVTEYGIADLRGKSDRDCVAAMLAVTDARFQRELLGAAQRARKIEADVTLGTSVERNSPHWLQKTLQPYCARGLFPEFPFGSDLTSIEQRIARALRRLKTWSHFKSQLAARAAAALLSVATDDEREPLERMQLGAPATLKDRLYKALMLSALRAERKP